MFSALRRRACALGTGVAVLLLVGGRAGARPMTAVRTGPGLHGSTNGHAPGYLGIGTRDMVLPPAASSGSHAVEVVLVDHDGPAGKAGLLPHDIIVSLNGQMVASSEALHRMLRETAAGVQVALQVLRGGRPLTITAQLADREQVARAAMARVAADPGPAATPESPTPAVSEVFGYVETYSVEAPPPPTPEPPAPEPAHPQGFFGSMLHSPPLMGVALDTMEPQLATFFGAPQGEGLLVHAVIAGSPAANAGLRAGDIVVRADAMTLHTSADWTRHLHSAKGRPVTLLVLRNRREMLLTLPPELKHHSLLEWPKKGSDE